MKQAPKPTQPAGPQPEPAKPAWVCHCGTRWQLAVVCHRCGNIKPGFAIRLEEP